MLLSRPLVKFDSFIARGGDGVVIIERSCIYMMWSCERLVEYATQFAFVRCLSLFANYQNIVSWYIEFPLSPIECLLKQWRIFVNRLSKQRRNVIDKSNVGWRIYNLIYY